MAGKSNFKLGHYRLMGLLDIFGKKDWNIIYPNSRTGRQACDVLPDRMTAVSTLALMLSKGVVPNYVNYGNSQITKLQLQDLFIDAIIIKTLQEVCEEDGCEIEKLMQSFKPHDATFGRLLNRNCESLADQINTNKNDFMLAVGTRLSGVGLSNIFNQKAP